MTASITKTRLHKLFLLDPKNIDNRPYGSLFNLNQYDRLFRYVLRNCHTTDSILDWGSGNGHFSLFLSDHSYTNISSCEFEESPFLSRFPISTSFKPLDAKHPTHIPFASTAFDYVFSVGVLEHVRESSPSELPSLQEIRRVLVPGGYFVCYHLPNKYSLTEAVSRLIAKPSHQYLYTRKRIHELFHSAGLELVACYRYSLLPRNVFSNRFLSPFSNLKPIVFALELFDNIISILLNPLCQSFFVVARRPQ